MVHNRKRKQKLVKRYKWASGFLLGSMITAIILLLSLGFELIPNNTYSMVAIGGVLGLWLISNVFSLIFSNEINTLKHNLSRYKDQKKHERLMDHYSRNDFKLMWDEAHHLNDKNDRLFMNGLILGCVIFNPNVDETLKKMGLDKIEAINNALQHDILDIKDELSK